MWVEGYLNMWWFSVSLSLLSFFLYAVGPVLILSGLQVI